MDGAIGRHELIRGHAGIADNDEPRFRVEADEFVHRVRLVDSRRIFPQIVIDRIVKEEGLEVLELGPCIVEKDLDHLDIGIHRPSTVVDGQNHL